MESATLSKRRLVLLGPPGSGKGTHAELLLEQFQLPTLSTGSQLRREMAAGTELGLRAHALTKDGNFVPDEMVLQLAGNWLTEHRDGFVLDGFPRTLNQAKALDVLLDSMSAPVQIAIALEVSVSVLEERIVKRIICGTCQHTMQVDAPPSGVAEDLPRCPKCGGQMHRRADDSLETLEKRLREYRAKTEPLIPYYEARGLLIRVNAEREVGAVFADIRAALQ